MGTTVLSRGKTAGAWNWPPTSLQYRGYEWLVLHRNLSPFMPSRRGQRKLYVIVSLLCYSLTVVHSGRQASMCLVCYSLLERRPLCPLEAASRFLCNGYDSLTIVPYEHMCVCVCVCVRVWRSRSDAHSQRTPFPARLRIIRCHLDHHLVTGQLSSDITVILH
jgi:hypothetical protein